MGFIFHTPVGPRFENWPIASSMKYIGFPMSSWRMMYGMRKAAGQRTRHSSHYCGYIIYYCIMSIVFHKVVITNLYGLSRI